MRQAVRAAAVRAAISSGSGRSETGRRRQRRIAQAIPSQSLLCKLTNGDSQVLHVVGPGKKFAHRCFVFSSLFLFLHTVDLLTPILPTPSTRPPPVGSPVGMEKRLQNLHAELPHCGSVQDVLALLDSLTAVNTETAAPADCRLTAGGSPYSPPPPDGSLGSCILLREWADSAGSSPEDAASADAIRLAAVRLAARALTPRFISPAALSADALRKLMDVATYCTSTSTGGVSLVELCDAFVTAVEAGFLPPTLCSGSGGTPGAPGAALSNPASVELANSGAAKAVAAAFAATVGRMLSVTDGRPEPGSSSALRAALLGAVRLERTAVFAVINEAWKSVSALCVDRGGEVEALHARDGAALRTLLLLGDNGGRPTPQLFSIPWLLCVLLRRLSCAAETFMPIAGGKGSAAIGRPLSGVDSAFAPDLAPNACVCSVAALHAVVGAAPPALPSPLSPLLGDARAPSGSPFLSPSLFPSPPPGGGDGSSGVVLPLKPPPTPRVFEFFAQHLRRLLRLFPHHACSPIAMECDPAVPGGLFGACCAGNSSLRGDGGDDGDGVTFGGGGGAGPASHGPLRLHCDPSLTPADLLVRLLRGLAHVAHSPGLPYSAVGATADGLHSGGVYRVESASPALQVAIRTSLLPPVHSSLLRLLLSPHGLSVAPRRGLVRLLAAGYTADAPSSPHFCRCVSAPCSCGAAGRGAPLPPHPHQALGTFHALAMLFASVGDAAAATAASPVGQALPPSLPLAGEKDPLVLCPASVAAVAAECVAALPAFSTALQASAWQLSAAAALSHAAIVRSLPTAGGGGGDTSAVYPAAAPSDNDVFFAHASTRYAAAAAVSLLVGTGALSARLQRLCASSAGGGAAASSSAAAADSSSLRLLRGAAVKASAWLCRCAASMVTAPLEWGLGSKVLVSLLQTSFPPSPQITIPFSSSVSVPPSSTHVTWHGSLALRTYGVLEEAVSLHAVLGCGGSSGGVGAGHSMLDASSSDSGLRTSESILNTLRVVLQASLWPSSSPSLLSDTRARSSLLRLWALGSDSPTGGGGAGGGSRSHASGGFSMASAPATPALLPSSLTSLHAMTSALRVLQGATLVLPTLLQSQQALQAQRTAASELAAQLRRALSGVLSKACASMSIACRALQTATDVSVSGNRTEGSISGAGGSGYGDSAASLIRRCGGVLAAASALLSACVAQEVEWRATGIAIAAAAAAAAGSSDDPHSAPHLLNAGLLNAALEEAASTLLLLLAPASTLSALQPESRQQQQQSGGDGDDGASSSSYGEISPRPRSSGSGGSDGCEASGSRGLYNSVLSTPEGQATLAHCLTALSLLPSGDTLSVTRHAAVVTALAAALAAPGPDGDGAAAPPPRLYQQQPQHETHRGGSSVSASHLHGGKTLKSHPLLFCPPRGRSSSSPGGSGGSDPSAYLAACAYVSCLAAPPVLFSNVASAPPSTTTSDGGATAAGAGGRGSGGGGWAGSRPIFHRQNKAVLIQHLTVVRTVIPSLYALSHGLWRECAVSCVHTGVEEGGHHLLADDGSDDRKHAIPTCACTVMQSADSCCVATSTCPPFTLLPIALRNEREAAFARMLGVLTESCIHAPAQPASAFMHPLLKAVSDAQKQQQQQQGGQEEGGFLTVEAVAVAREDGSQGCVEAAVRVLALAGANASDTA